MAEVLILNHIFKYNYLLHELKKTKTKTSMVTNSHPLLLYQNFTLIYVSTLHFSFISISYYIL